MPTGFAYHNLSSRESKARGDLDLLVRKALGIEEGGLLSLDVKGESIIMAPLRPIAKPGGALRSYTRAEIERFLEEDKLDEKTAKRVKKLLGIKG